MASSLNWNATSSCLRRFSDYLNGLREEFELQSNATVSRSRRFYLLAGNLRGEFELMAEDVELLRKERNEFKAKVDAHAKELQNVRNNFVCQRCSKGTTTTPRVIASSHLKASETALPPSRLGFQFQSLHKQSTFSQVVLNPSQPTQVPRSTQRITVSRKLQSVVTPIQRVQSVSTNQFPRSDTINVARNHVILSSPITKASASAVYPGPGPEDPNWSIQFNNQVKKELDVEIVHTLFHGKPIGRVQFSQDGRYLAAGCYDGKTYIYDIETGILTCVLRNLLVNFDPIDALCFSRDGKYLATGAWNGNILIWDIKTKHVRNAFKGHTCLTRSLDFSPNGHLVVSASQDNTVRLWNIRDGAAKVLVEGDPISLDVPHYISAVFRPDGRYIAASHSDGMVRIWDGRTGQLIRRLKAHTMSSAYDVAFMPDGKGLVSGGGDLKYWNIRTANTSRFHVKSQTTNNLQEHDSGVGEQTRPERQFLGHKDVVFSLAISPDGRWVASGSRDHTVRIWDIRNAAMQCTLNGHNTYVDSVDFSPAGQYLASGGRKGKVIVYRYLHSDDFGGRW